MKKIALSVLSLIIAASAAACAQEKNGDKSDTLSSAERIKKAIDNKSRTESNLERDADRKPEQILTFFGAEGGDAILDYGVGGGYYSQL